MKSEQIEMKADVMLASSLQQSLKASTAKLAKKRNRIKNYCERQATAPTADKSDKAEKPTPPKKALAPQIKLSDDEQQAVIDWAKQHYRDVADIKRCGDELNIKPGQVYHLLKAHSFIPQKDTAEHRILAAYYRHNGDLKKITEDVGLGVWIVAKTVESFGYSPRWQDYKNSRYAIKRGSLGLSAERKFKEFVPDAVDANEELRECNPVYDFVVGDYTVDVKEATPLEDKRTKGGSEYFLTRISNSDERADFYCLFLCYDKESRLEGDYSVLLIPNEVIPDVNRIQISLNPETQSNQFYFQFEVEPIALPYMLGVED